MLRTTAKHRRGIGVSQRLAVAIRKSASSAALRAPKHRCDVDLVVVVVVVRRRVQHLAAKAEKRGARDSSVLLRGSHHVRHRRSRLLRFANRALDADRRADKSASIRALQKRGVVAPWCRQTIHCLRRVAAVNDQDRENVLRAREDTN
jgi:hypothetical protein